jgi:nicotinate phosphoribosyltransferase
MKDVPNLTLHTDKYQINMMYAHWKQGTHRQKAVFEVYFRKLPFGNGFAVFAGLERVVRYIQDLSFGEDEIAYLSRQEEEYESEFLEELRRFRFSGDLFAVAEGTVVFADEQLIRVEAPIFEAQLVETAILNFVNYQTLVATKAARIKQVTEEDGLLEFGTRRAQEADAAVWGARAAYLVGFDATSNLRAGMMFDIPTKGTHAHAWVQFHEDEEKAFKRFAESLPDQVTLLVDTYDTLKSGVPSAIRTAKWLEGQGKQMQAIRLDSGDLAYLSKAARQQLDAANLQYVKIVASNDLDEHLIAELKAQGAKIDIWGVGTQLITAADQPSLGGVYKLAACERDGVEVPVIKISGNPEKVSNPGRKDLFRILHPDTGMAEADYIPLSDERDLVERSTIKLFDPAHPYLHKFMDRYEAVPLLRSIFSKGSLVYDLPDLQQIREYHQQQLKLFWPEYLRKRNPAKYPVDLSEKAYRLKMDMIHQWHK